MRNKPALREKRPTKTSRMAPKSGQSGKILFRYRASDTMVGVSRKTAARMAQTLGLSETQTIHLALARLAQEAFPRYEPDDRDLTHDEIAAIRRLEPQGRMATAELLFP
jgi:hypothetical protein